MSRHSLRLRLLFAAAISVSIALVIAGFGLVELFGRHVERRARAELTTYIDQLAAGVRFADNGTVELPGTLADPRFRRVFSGLYWQVREEGTHIVLRSRSLWDHVLPLPSDELAPGVVHSHTLPGPQDSELLIQERQIIYETPAGIRTLRFAAALDKREIAAERAAFASEIFPALSLLGLTLIVAAWIQVSLGLRPMEAVRRGVNAIRARRQQRLKGSFPDEVMPLVTEVNDLLQAQDAAIEQARTRAGDMAHGLKTPLTVLAGDARKLRDRGEVEIAAEVEDLAHSMQRHIDYELVRTRAAFDARRRGVEADLAATAVRLVTAMRRTPRGEALEWSLELPDSLPVALDPRDLTEVAGNLLENATKWARSRVTVAVEQDSEMAALVICDDGKGVPEKQIGQLGKRGQRLDEAMPGSGLGLAIVREIVEAYGGKLELKNVKSGGFTAIANVPLWHAPPAL